MRSGLEHDYNSAQAVIHVLGINNWYVVNIRPSEVSRGFLIRPSHKYISLQAMPAKPL